ncbi:MerR family transcriptional regulator [Lysinibacillus sp. Bpr_S20]|uniref:MerR family transcriptional regulator n=1 Tax=Lysinibacillus sp. Bpr_S20 TaxID=2933964 RepID=UPI0020137DB7|nr:MerR family transcriptional regulator [Lysinibacillus sp. Bpr_S20]MCL1702963.1 MerR family transcriptional regulator [Lysinibacillus sp. Bpr_S20]
MSTQYSIGEFAKKTGVTIRTLHYYDEIDLLKPSFTSAAGRRFYSNDDIIKIDLASMNIWIRKKKTSELNQF